DLLLIVAVEQAQAPRHWCAGVVEPAIELGARSPAVARECCGRRTAARSLVRTDAQVKVRYAKGHRQIAVEHADLRRRMRGADLPGGPLDQRPERDFVPVLLEKLAKQLFQTGLVRRERKNLDRRPIGLGHGPRAGCGRHARFPSWLAARD